MGLKEDAIAEYEKEKELIKKNRDEEIKRAIDEGIKTIRSKLGDNLKVEAKIEGDDILFFVEGLKLRIGKSDGYYRIICLVQKCPKCGEEFQENIINIRDIGKVLVEGHKSYECEEAIKAKTQKKELTTDERFLEAMRNFIYENCGGE